MGFVQKAYTACIGIMYGRVGLTDRVFGLGCELYSSIKGVIR